MHILIFMKFYRHYYCFDCIVHTRNLANLYTRVVYTLVFFSLKNLHTTTKDVTCCGQRCQVEFRVRTADSFESDG